MMRCPAVFVKIKDGNDEAESDKSRSINIS